MAFQDQSKELSQIGHHCCNPQSSQGVQHVGMMVAMKISLIARSGTSRKEIGHLNKYSFFAWCLQSLALLLTNSFPQRYPLRPYNQWRLGKASCFGALNQPPEGALLLHEFLRYHRPIQRISHLQKVDSFWQLRNINPFLNLQK